MDKIHYGVFQEFFKQFGINPYDFYVISPADRLDGWFPDLEDRVPKISVDRLAHMIWEKDEENNE